jgi:predicted metal-dependent HD superfamily phosphohydrolase
MDLDLTILGASPHDFARFEEQVRQEYAHVPALLYRLGRRRVLQGFLSRPRIYHVPQIREELEVRARANLERRLRELARGVWR